MRRVLLPILAVLSLGVVLVVGLGQASGGDEPERGGAQRFSLASAQERLAGAPAPLAALHAQANELLPGGERAFSARLRALRGHPVVVNKWASWCGPCQAEFPFFQEVATRRGKSVAFVGVDSDDSSSEARTFLRDHPIPFPSYEDPDKKIAGRFGRMGLPTTIFLDERGEQVFLHQGQYRSSAALAADVDRYLTR